MTPSPILLPCPLATSQAPTSAHRPHLHPGAGLFVAAGLHLRSLDNIHSFLISILVYSLSDPPAFLWDPKNEQVILKTVPNEDLDSSDEH